MRAADADLATHWEGLCYRYGEPPPSRWPLSYRTMRRVLLWRQP